MQPTHERKKKVLKHVYYEIKQFLFLARYFNEVQDQELKNACLESFLMHTRILLEFFTNSRRWKDNVLASDYKISPQKIDIENGRLNKDLAHLTYSRLERGLITKGWDLNDIIQKMIFPIREFIDHLLKSNYLSQDNKEDQDWKELQKYSSSIPYQKQTNTGKGKTLEVSRSTIDGATNSNFSIETEKGK